MSTIKKLAGQTAIYGVSSILGRLLNYLLVPIHTDFFNPEGYGVVGEFYAYVAFFTVLLTFGMETTFFRFINKADDKKLILNQSFTILLIINSLFLILVLLNAQSIANWMLYPEHKNYVIWFACILVTDSITSLFLAKLRQENRAKLFAMVQLTSIGVNVGLNLILLFGFLNSYPSIGVGFIFIANLFGSLIKPILLYKDIKQSKLIWDKVVSKAMLLYALPLAIGGFAGIINETFDRILIKRLLMDKGAAFAQSQVGIYSANYKISIFITLFIQAFRFAAEPFFFQHEKHQNKEKIYSKVMTYFVIVITFIFLVITQNLDIFKWFIPNEEYWEGLKVVPILLLANIFLGIYFNQSIWYKLADKTKYGAYISIIGAIITIILNWILIPIMGYMGAAWTTLITYFLMSVISYVIGQKIYPIHYNLRKIGLYLGLSLFLFFIGQIGNGFESSISRFIFHNIWVGLFLGVIFFLDNPIKLIKSEKS